MKRFTITLILLLSCITLIAQVPAAFSYQAVVRNTSGEVIADKSVSLKISILRDSDTGTPVYVERHNTSTNEFGLVNLAIGNGTVISGIFDPGGWGLN